MTDQLASLTWDVYVASPEPTVDDNLPPVQQRTWS
jgi:hypothetical protein